MSESSTDHAALLKRAFRKIEELQVKLDAVQQPLSEPIAVVGMACRFPGGADDPQLFWDLLRGGGDGITEIPPNRWNVEEYYDPTPGTPGKMYTRWGGFLRNIEEFDPQFFGISPREAVSMDPQQRLLLEVCWEALEHSGLAPQRLVGTRTGVFLGISGWDYDRLLARTAELPDTYSATGSAHSIAAGRVSYVLGLQGPNVALDTACSSSLVATHLACQSIRLGESRMALAAGVNLILNPDATVATSQARMMAADGHCKTFDAAADGYVRSEGCGVLVLKSLRDALADGDRVLALIRGTAINQDGRSSGITAPNGPAQEAVIREALRRGGISGLEVDYVEAHGTGTSLGDPIEINALAAVLSKGRPLDRPLLIGAVKANIGHTESAAGIAGIIKVILALQHQEIPPQLHLKTLNPLVPWKDLPIAIVKTPVSWRRGDRRRIAGISAFGFSGTNAHVIVEEAPLTAASTAEVDRPLHILTLSAKTPESLHELAARYTRCLDASTSLANLCFTANAGRAHFAERLALVAASPAEAREKLEAIAADREVAGVYRGRIGERARPSVAFLFTGQGAQYVGMGRQLFETQPTFRGALTQCDEILRSLLPQPLLPVLWGEGGAGALLDQTSFTQPALFALEYALAQLWRSWGVEPAVVMGHSVGEYVAACVAGLFSLEDGLRLIAGRAALMQALPPGGKMAAVFADERRVTEGLATCADRVAIAAVNGPEAVVISGDGASVATVLDSFAKQGIRSQQLAVSHAFHSPLLEPMLGPFEELARRLTFSTPRVGIVSNVTGRMGTTEELADPRYWRRHAREAVRFAAGIATLCEQGCDVFLEIGPHPTLVGMGARCVPEGTGLWLPSLRKGRDNWQQMLDSLAALYAQGVAVDWGGFERDYPRQKVGLPTYPFQRARYWRETATPQRRVRSSGATMGRAVEHPLLGRRLRSALRDVQYECELGCGRLPFLKDHAFFGRVVLPGAAYVEMALTAATTLGSGVAEIEDLSIEEPLLLAHDANHTVQFILSADGGFQIYSCVDDAETGIWKRHAIGRLRVTESVDSREGDPLEVIRARCGESWDVERYYALVQTKGVEYGPAFQGIEALWGGSREAVAIARVPADLASAAGAYQFHPTLLDAGFQALGAALVGEADRLSLSDVYMPTAIKHLRLFGPIGNRVWIHSAVAPGPSDGRSVKAELRFFNEAGETVAAVEELELRRVGRHSLEAAVAQEYHKWLYELAWEEKPLSAQPKPNECASWLILADSSGLGERLAGQLEARGHTAFLVAAGDRERRLDERRYEVDPQQRGHFERLIRSTLNADPCCRGVIYLWALDDRMCGSDPLSGVNEPGLRGALHLAQGLAGAVGGTMPRLLLVTRGAQSINTECDAVLPQQAPLWGLGRTIGLEHPDMRCTCVDLEPGDGQEDAALAELLADDGEQQIAYRNGARHVARLTRLKLRKSLPPAVSENQAVQLQIPTRGVLDNLQLVPVQRRPPAKNEIEIEVAVAGLNFRDVLNALGMYPGDPGPLGGECVGRISALGDAVESLNVGDWVMGLAHGAFCSYVTTPVQFVTRLPEGLSPSAAATIPIAFLTAHYALNRLAGLRSGERVLIHAAAGGVGMAAVQLAQLAGAEIFATAGNPAKRALLKSMGVTHVMDSRSLAFADEILERTSGEGVDVVLNSLSGEFIPKSLNVLRKGGRFLELGKRDIWDEDQVRQANPDVQYFVIYLGAVAEESPALIDEMLNELARLLKSGAVRPLPCTVFSVCDASTAFRYMAQAKHVGKVVLRQDVGHAAIRSDAAYLVTGGLGSLGLVVARHLVDQGARHVALVSRRGPTEEAQRQIGEMENLGAHVVVIQADVSSKEDIKGILDQIDHSLPSLRGVIHAAGLLDDGVLLQQDWSRFERVMRPKVEGAWQLHLLTLERPLDFFVMFSSVASLLGSAGQSNYAAANAFMDGLARLRRRQGLPALSINWGAWSEVGMSARLDERDQSRGTRLGIDKIPPIVGAHVLQHAMAAAVSQCAVLPVDWSVFLSNFPKGEEPPLFRRMVGEVAHEPGGARREAQEGVRRRLDAAPPGERERLLLTYVREQVAQVLGADSSRAISAREGFTDMGMDSLMAVELRNRLQMGLSCSVPSTLMFEYPTIEALVGHLCGDVFGWVPPAAMPGGTELTAAQSRELDSLSEKQLAASLLDELREAGY